MSNKNIAKIASVFGILNMASAIFYKSDVMFLFGLILACSFCAALLVLEKLP